MRRLAVSLVAVLFPVGLLAQSSQTTRVTVTPQGDTVLTYASAKTVPPVVTTLPPELTIDSVVVKRAPVKPDTVKVPYPVPSPVVASSDTTFVATPYSLGKPFGPFNAFNGYTALQPGGWTATLQSTSPSGLLQQLATARAGKLKNIVLAMTGGSHSNYITNSKFDLAKWKAVQATFNTAAIKAAIDSAVKDGTVVGASVLDEPNHISWGGVPTPTMLDDMSRYVKALFPTLKTATVVQWDWQKGTSYASLDFIISQYNYRNGPVAAYVDSALTSTKRRGVGLMFSMNILDGGTKASPCPAGSYSTGNCSMTATEIAQAGKALLGSAACGLLMWQYTDEFMTRPENVTAFTTLATYAARQPAPPCVRP